jgi:hypothetical protein
MNSADIKAIFNTPSSEASKIEYASVELLLVILCVPCAWFGLKSSQVDWGFLVGVTASVGTSGLFAFWAG